MGVRILLFNGSEWSPDYSGGYYNKILVKLGIKEQTIEEDWTLVGWERSLEQLNMKADVVFFGDSITSNGDFQKYFSDKTIVNLGLPGDTLMGMCNRAGMISSVKPEKVFVMGGINSLTDNNSDVAFQEYKDMLEAVQESAPTAQIYIESILPVSLEKETDCADNCVVKEFNYRLESLAEEKKFVYIDLYSIFAVDGYLNPELSEDGIHLKQESYNYWFSAIEEYMTE